MEEDQGVDKTQQQYQLGDVVFAAVHRNNCDCLIEGKVCGVSKPYNDENAEVRYTVVDIAVDDGQYKPYSEIAFNVAYDDVFEDLESAQQKMMDTINLNYQKAKDALASMLNAVKAEIAKQSTVVEP